MLVGIEQREQLDWASLRKGNAVLGPMKGQGAKSPGGSRPGAGRKATPIDLIELEKLSSLHCSDEEIAAWFGVSVRTLQNRRAQPKFGDVMRRGAAKGRISLRRAQMRLVEAGNVPMTLWLGKNLLRQRDHHDRIHLSLPAKMETAQDVDKAAEAVTQALGCGKISPTQGEIAMRVLALRSRMIEDIETVRRIEKLEENWASRDGLPRAA